MLKYANFCIGKWNEKWARNFKFVLTFSWKAFKFNNFAFDHFDWKILIDVFETLNMSLNITKKDFTLQMTFDSNLLCFKTTTVADSKNIVFLFFMHSEEKQKKEKKNWNSKPQREKINF